MQNIKSFDTFTMGRHVTSPNSTNLYKFRGMEIAEIVLNIVHSVNDAVSFLL